MVYYWVSCAIISVSAISNILSHKTSQRGKNFDEGTLRNLLDDLECFTAFLQWHCARNDDDVGVVNCEILTSRSILNYL